MSKPMGQFFLTDPFTTSLGWSVAPGQSSIGALAYINNQSPQEFAIYGNGTNFLGTAPAWISFTKITLDLLYSYIEFRPTLSVNPLLKPSLYVNGVVFESYEHDPGWQPIAVVRQIDQARQQRNVDVPMGLSHWSQGLWLAGDPATVVLQTVFPSAAQLAGLHMPIYCYYANMAPETGTTGSMSFTIEVQWQTAGSVNVGTPFIFTRGVVAANNANQTISPWEFNPTWPFAYIGPNMPGTAAKALIQMTYQNGVRLNIDYTVSASQDPFNLVGNPDIGVQAAYDASNPGLNPYF
jgi:hypothetical protein